LTFVRENVIWLALSVLLILTPGLGGFAFAQTVNDTIIPKSKPEIIKHSPSKATILAAVIPGAGQAYNRKYWKIPIVYVGVAAAGYAIYSNQKNYKDSKNSYIALTDTIESTVYEGNLSEAQLITSIDYYRRYRDMSVLALLAWHGLTIIDANVDAHFFNWDVSEDLSLRVRPRALWVGKMKPGIGLSLNLNIK
jgi:hypothetical protein